MLSIVAAAAAWQSRPAVDLCSRTPTLTTARARAPVAAATGARVDAESTITTISGLLDDPRAFLQQAQEDPSTLLQLVKDAGIAGAISYTVVELSFFSIALPIGYFSWHASTGEWLQPLLLLQDVSDATHAPRANTHPRRASHSQPRSQAAAQPSSRAAAAWVLSALLRAAQDGAEGKARVLGLLLSYVVLLKALFPLRLGSTLLLTPQIQRLLGGGGSVLGGLGLRGRAESLKNELVP